MRHSSVIGHDVDAGVSTVTSRLAMFVNVTLPTVKPRAASAHDAPMSLNLAYISINCTEIALQSI